MAKKFKIEPYCEDCPSFYPEIIKGKRFYGENDVIFASDDQIMCVDAAKSRLIYKYIKAELENKNENKIK